MHIFSLQSITLYSTNSDYLASRFCKPLLRFLAIKKCCDDFQIWRDEMQLVYLDNVILPDEVDQ
jgi:hypothetical protein